jgi:hypothetical protein
MFLMISENIARNMYSNHGIINYPTQLPLVGHFHILYHDARKHEYQVLCYSQGHAPAVLPPGKTRYPLYRRLGEPQNPSGKVGKISSPPGFDLWTVQPVASRYTDYAIPAPFLACRFLLFISFFMSLSSYPRPFFFPPLPPFL